MNGQETALTLIWVAVGIIVGFFLWQYVSPYLPARTTA